MAVKHELTDEFQVVQKQYLFNISLIIFQALDIYIQNFTIIVIIIIQRKEFMSYNVYTNNFSTSQILHQYQQYLSWEIPFHQYYLEIFYPPFFKNSDSISPFPSVQNQTNSITHQINEQIPKDNCSPSIAAKTVRKSNSMELKIMASAKKNSEGNIINQCFSYFINIHTSVQVIQKAIARLSKPKSQEKRIKQIFYRLIKIIIQQRHRKYVNKQAFLNLFNPRVFQASYPDLYTQIEKQEEVTPEEMCFLFRACIFHYMRGESINGILTSKRINAIARKEHIKRRNKLSMMLTFDLS